jgi:hypothetical protein
MGKVIGTTENSRRPDVRRSCTVHTYILCRVGVVSQSGASALMVSMGK